MSAAHTVRLDANGSCIALVSLMAIGRQELMLLEISSTTMLTTTNERELCGLV